MTIFQAVEAGDVDSVRTLLEQTPAVANARDDHDATPLHLAAIEGPCEIANALIDAGGDVNAHDGRFSATPAGWAIEYLRERGALLGIEIADAKLAIERGDVFWVERWLKRFPALKAARDAHGQLLSDVAKETGNPAIASLF